MIKFSGDNVFKENIFSWNSWSAPVLQSPDEVYHAFNALKILGKRIAAIKAVGYGYNLDGTHIGEFIFRYLLKHGKSAEEAQQSMRVPDMYDKGMPFPVWMEIDEPVIIFFDDDDRLEIDFSEGSSIRVSKNCIPIDIESKNERNFSAEILFSRCAGETLVGVNAKSSAKLPEFTGSYGIELAEGQKEYIESVSLLLSSGLKIVFKPCYDYGNVSLVTNLDKPVEILFRDLKQALSLGWEKIIELENLSEQDRDENSIKDQVKTTQTVKETDAAGEFFGEHFEALGDVWGAMLGGSEKLPQLLSEAIAKGEKTDSTLVLHNGREIDVLMLQYPNEGLIKTGILLAKTKNDESWIFYSAYPILEGINNALAPTATHTWENGLEGVVAADRTPDGPPVVFFDPFYFKELGQLKLGTEQNITLAALALSIQQAGVDEFTVDKGAFYEGKLKEFLDGNPGKSRDDFSPPKITMRGARILLPSQYACEWKYRCQVITCCRLSYLETMFYRMSVIFVGDDGEELKGYLYAPEHVLGDYKPQIGHDVEGVLWMTGYVASAESTNQPPQSTLRILIGEKNCYGEIPILPRSSFVSSNETEAEMTINVLSYFGAFSLDFDLRIDLDDGRNERGKKNFDTVFYCETEEAFDYWRDNINDFIQLMRRVDKFGYSEKLDEIYEHYSEIIYGNDFEGKINSLTGDGFTYIEDFIMWFNDDLDAILGKDA